MNFNTQEVIDYFVYDADDIESAIGDDFNVDRVKDWCVDEIVQDHSDAVFDVDWAEVHAAWVELIEEAKATVVVIDGDTERDAEVSSHGDMYEIKAGGAEYYVYETREEAGETAREYYKDMAENDPSEFSCMVGEETLVQWGLGRSAGPGSTHVSSLDEWLDLWLDTPEEHLAGYDGEERGIVVSDAIADELGWNGNEGFAYRNN